MTKETKEAIFKKRFLEFDSDGYNEENYKEFVSSFKLIEVIYNAMDDCANLNGGVPKEKVELLMIGLNEIKKLLVKFRGQENSTNNLVLTAIKDIDEAIIEMVDTTLAKYNNKK